MDESKWAFAIGFVFGAITTAATIYILYRKTIKEAKNILDDIHEKFPISAAINEIRDMAAEIRQSFKQPENKHNIT